MTFDSVRHELAFRSGTMLLRKGRWGPAAFLLGRAAKLAPQHWESHNNLAIAYLKLGRWKDAARVAECAVRLDPAATESLDFVGIALLQLERWEEAVVAYRRAITVDAGQYQLYDRLGMALSQLKRWDEVIATYEVALKLDAGHYAAHHRVGFALLQLRRWDAAAAAFRRAIVLVADDPAAAAQLPVLQFNLASAVSQLDGSEASDEATAALLERAAALHPDAAARLNHGIELLKRERWQEALSELTEVGALTPALGGVHFLRIDPLVRLGRLAEAADAHHQAVAAGGLIPRVPGPPVAPRFEHRRAAFWTTENLGTDVFAVERWLEQLSLVPDHGEASPGPTLMFVLDNDFGELATVKFFVLGQELAGRTTLLLPERLYVHNVDAIPGRTHQYASVEDILQAADQQKPDIVFLVSGYLLCPHLQFSPADLARLIDELRERKCRVVTADPFLGMLSKQDPRTLIRFDVSREHAMKVAAAEGLSAEVKEMTKARRDAEERAWASFEQSEKILRDTYHLYPSYCDVPAHDLAETDVRNVAFFNDRLVRPKPLTPVKGTKPHWLFILATPDCENQAVFEEGAFPEIVASKLIETLAAGRHPILIGPKAFVEELVPRMPTTEGIDILSHCPFNQFYSLLLSAEHAFYWNVVSHSLLIRLYNRLPIIQFDRGHLVRSAPGIYDRIVGWYYQGFGPTLRDHREPLTLETVERWTEEYRQQADRLLGRYRRAPDPDQMIADIMTRAPAPGTPALQRTSGLTLASVFHWAAREGGKKLLRMQQWRPAAYLLGRAAKLAPNNWESNNNLAIAYLKLGRWEEAAGIAQRAIRCAPAASESHDFFGMALLQMERWEEAVVAYRRAITVDAGQYELYDRLGMALSQLKRWDEVVATYEVALKLDAGHHAAHQRIGIALLQLRRWDDAAAAFRRAIALAKNDSAAPADYVAGLQLSLNRAETRPESSRAAEEHSAPAVALHQDTAAYVLRGVELLVLEQWREAIAELTKGSVLTPDLGSLHFLRIDPLIRLGRFQEAVTAHRQAVAAGGDMPSLPGQPAAERFAQRQETFWTAGNLGADVFAVERWLAQLSVIPDEAEVISQPQLLFVLDNDYGELTTLMYLVLGQQLACRATVLLPERLYLQNPDAVPGRTHRYASVDDVLKAVDRARPPIVFLCSGYLLCEHLEFRPDDLERLIDQLRERGCRVVTSDPFLGMLSKQDPRTLISIDVPADHPDFTVEQMTKAKRGGEERMWSDFTHAERTLRNTFHLYPTYCDVLEREAAQTDVRNIAFFNEKIVRSAPRLPATTGASHGEAGKPHWLFVLASADYDAQLLFEGGRWVFVDTVARKLLETVAAGRHPILIAPGKFVEMLIARMPTSEGIDILSHCAFTRFISLLLSAECAFYWNVVSHSLLIRLYNKLPVVLFDRGHLVRVASGIYHRVVSWYYQGWEPPFRDHRERLTLETVAGWTDEYRQQADRLAERYRRAPSPDQMIADLMGRAATPGLQESVRDQ
jgi:tetratricopeptide (TPR) repeat protein